MSGSADPDWSDHCGDMAARHVLAATGLNVETLVGPMPRRAREWVAQMRRLGVRSLSGVVSAALGAPLVSPKLARRGDIVRRGWALGICRGERAEFYGGQLSPMREIDEGWRLN